MYNPWFDSTLLALESSRVVALRVFKLAWGGSEAQAESERMISEKLTANAVATMTLLTGGSMQTVIAGYREIVTANADRLLDGGMCSVPRAL